MVPSLILDEIRLTLRVRRGLSESELRRILAALRHRRFITRLRHAVRDALYRDPALRGLAIGLSR